MIPIRDDNPHFLTPIVTLAIIGLNLAVWLLVQGYGTEPRLVYSVCNNGLIPAELLGTLPPGTGFRVSPTAACVIGQSPNWGSLVTHMFMHGGWMHIIGNMWFLWVFGNNVEDSMGHTRFAVFYLLCGLAAALVQMLLSAESVIPMVGASGAIGGVMGGYVVLYPRVKVHMLVWIGFIVFTVAVPAFWMLGYWLVVQLVGGIGALGAQGAGVAFWAHVGGFIAGAILVLGFQDRELVRRHPNRGF